MTNAETTSRLEMRWVPVSTADGRTRMEARWVELDRASQAPTHAAA